MAVITDMLGRMPCWDRVWTRGPTLGAVAESSLAGLHERKRRASMRSTLAITHHDGINHTPAFAIALEGHLALIREGLAPEAQIVSWDDQAIVAAVDGEPAGVMLWRKPDHWRDVSLDLGYVRPAFRRLGAYRAMWDALVVKAQDCGARRITSVTSVDNVAMRVCAAKLGRREATLGLWFDVPAQKTAKVEP